MSCPLITVGVPKDCTISSGGITNIWITDFVNVLTITESGGLISAITLASGTNYHEYVFNKFTSTFSEKGTINIQNGSAFEEQTVTLKLARRNKTTRNALAMLFAKNLSIIVKDSNGLYWLIGEAHGANLSDLPSESGIAMGDANGYTLTFTASEPVQASEIDSTIIAALVV